MSEISPKQEEYQARVRELVRKDGRYREPAYGFVSDAVTYTVAKLSEHRHVSATELLEGLREYAQKEYDIFAPEILHEWGIHTASDVGNLVYAMIGVGILAASKDDNPTDFDIPFDPVPPPEKAVAGRKPKLPRIDLI